MPGQLVLHRGGWEATKADLASVPVPSETDSYVPVPYGRFVEEVELHVPRFGLQITDARYALAREGQQMFGVLTCRNGGEHADYALAIGLRSSSMIVPFPSGSLRGPGSSAATTSASPARPARTASTRSTCSGTCPTSSTACSRRSPQCRAGSTRRSRR